MKKTNDPCSWSVGWGYSERCNMSCKFCYSSIVRSGKQLPVGIPVAMNFVAINASTIDAINWGTGENTLEPQWWDIIDAIRSEYPGIRQGLTTNGSLFPAISSSSRCASIAAAALDEVDVSIDFADSSRHDELRGYMGAFSMAIKAGVWSLERGKLVTLVMIGTKKTMEIENLAGIIAIARDHGFLFRLNLLREIQPLPDLRPRPVDVVNALQYLLRECSLASISDPLLAALACVSDHFNHSPVNTCRILPDGSITPSTYLVTDKWIGAHLQDCNLRLADINMTTQFVKFGTNCVPRQCQVSSCPLVERCRGGCFDRRWLRFGDIEHPDPLCPVLAGCLPRVERLTQGIRRTPIRTIHQDYLPTIIFKP